MKIPSPYVALGAVVALGVVALYVFTKAKGGAKNAGAAIGSGAAAVITGVAQGVISAVPSVVDGVVSAGVYGIGDAVGIPRTNDDACSKALAEGRTWDASFACPASRFLASLGGRETVSQDVLDANDARARRSPAQPAGTPYLPYPTLDLNDSSTWGAP
jgi:hypothetical protein